MSGEVVLPACVRVLVGACPEALDALDPASVHAVITSPPYYLLRDYGEETAVAWPAVTYAALPGHAPITVPAERCALGDERTLDGYVGHLVLVFRAIARVLRADGTAWLNLGDTFASSGGRGAQGSTSVRVGRTSADAQMRKGTSTPPAGLKPKDLMLVPARVALALQADGWWLRDDIVWAKPNAMPDSAMDRATRSHETVFMLARSERYFFDEVAIRETATGEASRNRRHKLKDAGFPRASGMLTIGARATRKARNVWVIPTTPYARAHFAVMPPALATRCMLASTSERGCCEACGAPRQRIVEVVVIDDTQHPLTVGWEPTCSCNAPDVPCTVLDPFGGSGTVAMVTREHGRRAVLVEPQPDYLPLIAERVWGDQPKQLTFTDMETA